MSHLSEVFDDIYRNDRWGNGSGPGSKPISAITFLKDLTAFTKGKTALDVGCGDGRLAGCWAAFAASYLGVDVSAESIKLFHTSLQYPCVHMNAADAV